MSELSGFFDAHKVGGEWDRSYVAVDFARYFASFIKNGVFAGQSNELQVVQSNPPGMSVTVASGKSWIEGYFYYNDADLQLTLDNADGVLDRIDIIVCRWSSVDRTIKTYVKKGTAAISPVSPTPQWDADVKELQLASIQVNAGVVAISQSLITDTRPNTSVCGWVTSVIDQVDTSTLFLQWQDAYSKYFQEQKAAWDEFFDSVQKDLGTPVMTTITLSAAGWKNATSPYQQTVVVGGLNRNSKIDFQLTQTQAAWFERTALFAVNEGGTVTVYALGDKPTKDMTLQVVLSNVMANGGKIVGGLVGTLAPRGDFAQTDEGKPDYIRNKPDLSGYLKKNGGSMTGALTTKGIILTPGVDFFDSLPGTVTPNKLVFVKVG